MRTVVLLCGTHFSGKTKTLKKFFGISHDKRLEPMLLRERVLDGKKVHAVSLSSPQELVKDFCNVEEVKKNIDKRLKKCDEKASGQDYIFIIPFTMFVQGNRINERCILEPIEWLKSLNMIVFPVYLRRVDVDLLNLNDALMKKISAPTIESKKDEENRQAKELEDIIKKL